MTLKIKPEDLQVLRDAIRPLDTGEKRLAYLRGDFPRAERCTNLDKRYRWDLLYASGLKIGDGAGVVGDLDLYAYLDDTHIDSALREIVPLLWSHSLTLKIRPADLQVLRNAIAPHDTSAKRRAYLRGEFPRAEQCTNLDKRYRWDLLYASGLKIGDGVGVQGDLNLYEYLDDKHIDSALQYIVPLLWSNERTKASA